MTARDRPTRADGGAEAPFLAVDLGNTRCKACLFPAQGASPAALFDVPAAEALATVVLVDLPPGTRAALSCVAEPEAGRALAAALGERLGIPATFNPDSGLALEVEGGETVGSDRLYAARGAIDRAGEGVLVVDAGTALTVDAVLPWEPEPNTGRGADPRAGRFLGGAIAAGPDLLARALGAGGVGLWCVEPCLEAPMLGRDTTAALVSGVTHGFVGAALRLCAGVAAEAGLERPLVVLTGGRRELLTAALGEVAREVRAIEHLVHLGLAAACGRGGP